MGFSQERVRELLDEGAAHECEGVGAAKVCVQIAAIAELPTRFGYFQIVAFYNNKDNKEHVAIVRGDVSANLPAIADPSPMVPRSGRPVVREPKARRDSQWRAPHV